MTVPSPISGSERIQFDSGVGSKEINSWIGSGTLKVIQTSGAVPDSIWSLLNTEFFKKRPDVELRIYGFYGEVCDLSFLKLMSNVRRLAVDCLLNATGTEHISSLSKLEKLSVGIYNLDNFDFLQSIDPETLTDLSLEAAATKKIGLRVLERFSGLKRLYIEGHQKDVETISSLNQLEDLTLRSVTLGSLDFLDGIPNLWSLDIKLGGTTNLAALRKLTTVKYLELWQIKGLTDLSPISEMTGLQFLFLQSLRNVTQLPDCSKLISLRRVRLETMKGVTDLSPLETAPKLEELMHFGAKGFKSADYAGIIAKESIKHVFVTTGSARMDEILKEDFTKAGILSAHQRPFVFN